MPPKGADEGKTVIPLQARKRIPFGEVLFSGEKYPKAAGDTGAGGFYKPYAPVSPDPFLGAPPKPSGAKPGTPRKAERLSRGEEPQQNERALP